MANQEEQKKVVSRIKIKKKNWYKILSPKIFGLREIGETYLTSPESALGRKVQITLKELTGNVKDQNAYISFKISGVQGGKLTTDVRGYSLTQSYVRRAVKKNVNRFDNYVELVSKDGKKFIVKCLLVTIHKVTRSVGTTLDQRIKELLAEEAQKNDFDSLVNGLVYQKIQQSIRKQLNKVYPLREMAIRVLAMKEGESSTSTESSLPVHQSEPLSAQPNLAQE